ncbi:hypothetical protein PGB90_007489 [Kerria lacca]
MDTFNYILFKNPVITYSVAAIKYAAANVSGTTQNAKDLSQSSSLTKNDILHILKLNRNYLKIAGLFGATAVILGAYGAHTLLAKEGNEHHKKVFETASQYHFYHTIAFFAVPFCRFPKISAITLASGIIIFCGSCYYQSLTGNDSTRKITPYGGFLLILSWLTMIL